MLDVHPHKLGDAVPIAITFLGLQDPDKGTEEGHAKLLPPSRPGLTSPISRRVLFSL